MNQLICQVASSQIGVKEIVGEAHEQSILKYSTDIGLKGVLTDEVPWCAIFVCWVLFKCGLDYPVTARARDFETYGLLTKSPEPGDLVVFWRGANINVGLGHVGFFLGFSADHKLVFVLGGNQRNSVGIDAYSVSQVIGYRRAVADSDAMIIPMAPLGQHNTGENVKSLQKILLYLGFLKGKIDGFYGPSTITAVKDFQTKHPAVATSAEFGQYTKKMQDKFFEILNA